MSDRRYPANPTGCKQFMHDMAEQERASKMKIREGLRMVLTGFEELWGLPRSLTTKKEQGRRTQMDGSRQRCACSCSQATIE